MAHMNKVAQELDVNQALINEISEGTESDHINDTPHAVWLKALDDTDSTQVTCALLEQKATVTADPDETPEIETINSEAKVVKRKKKSIYNKRVAFYVKDARYDVVKRIAKNDFNWRNTYKDEEECNIIWSDIGLQPERLQNMKPFQ